MHCKCVWTVNGFTYRMHALRYTTIGSREIRIRHRMANGRRRLVRVATSVDTRNSLAACSAARAPIWQERKGIIARSCVASQNPRRGRVRRRGRWLRRKCDDTALDARSPPSHREALLWVQAKGEGSRWVPMRELDQTGTHKLPYNYTVRAINV